MESEYLKNVELIAEFDSYEEFSKSDFNDQEKYPSISVSKLKLFKKSPLHFKEHEHKETEAFEFGKAYHCYLLEPSEFDKRYFVFDESSIIEILKGEGSKKPRSTKKYSEWLELQYANAESRILLNAEDFERIKEMSNRILGHHYTRSIIRKGIAEKFLFVKIIDQFGNEFYIKLIADYFKKHKKLITDLKTCTDSSANGFQKDAAKYDYHIQAALYADIFEKLYSDGFRWDFLFLAQEKNKPYAFNVFSASNQFISQGRYEYEGLLMLWNECRKTGKYNGYQVWCENKYGVNEISLPPWAINEINYFIH